MKPHEPLNKEATCWLLPLSIIGYEFASFLCLTLQIYWIIILSVTTVDYYSRHIIIYHRSYHT